MNRINFVPRQLGLLLISLASVMALSGCSDSDTPVTSPAPAVACASYTPVGTDGRGDTALTAMAVRTAAAPNCVYETSFVDNDTPLTANITLAALDSDGVHVFEGSLIVGMESATLAGVPGTPVVLTIEAGATIAFANAVDRLIINRGAQIMAVGTAADPITFTSLADVEALATADDADDLAPTATDEWGGITINGVAFNNACTYSDPPLNAARRPFTADPFTLADNQPTLTADPTTGPVETCSLGAAVFTGATDANPGLPDLLAEGFHGGTSPDDNSGILDYVIIKHVGDVAERLEQHALHLRSVGRGTMLSNIEVYSVDGDGIQIEGGGADLTNVLVYNPQIYGVFVTDGYLGALDTVLVSQADGAGELCVLVESGIINGMTAVEITDGMNTRVTLRNLTCDVSADNTLGSGVVVLEGARARIQNAIIVGSRVAAHDGESTDNNCLELIGERSIIEADGVIASCLEASTVVTAANFLVIADGTVGERVIATNIAASSPTADEVATDIQFHDPTVGGTVPSPEPISPLAGADTALVVLSDADTRDSRALFSLLLTESTVNDVLTTVVASAVSPNASDRTYLGAITAVNNPFADWTFGIFGTP